MGIRPGNAFKNDLMADLRGRLRCTHHITELYCPWSSGTVEIDCCDLKRVLRVVLSEMGYPLTLWATTIPTVQGALNHTKLDRLGNRALSTACTGMPAQSAVVEVQAR